MKLVWKFVVCVVATLTFAILYQMTAKGSATAYAQSYYVDSVSGNDSNNGTASTSPWKTLGKVNATSFAPGDTVFFKAGSTFFGYLAPTTSGNSSASIRFDMYGSGAKPVIDASGVADPIGGEGVAAVQIYGKEYLEFTNLEVTNNPVIDTTLGRVPDNKDSYRLGFLIANDNIGRTLNHIVIKDCVVRDISRNIPYQSKHYTMGGISIFHYGANSTWNDILIENVSMSNVSVTGIYEIFYNWNSKIWNPNGPNGEPANDYNLRSSSIVVRNVSMTDIQGNGIAIGHTNGALIDHSKVSRFAIIPDEYFVGIWIHNTDNSMIQYCEASGGEMNGALRDSEGFDFDKRVKNSTLQYSYSHDNAGGFLLNGLDEESTNNTFRYNISHNDKTVLVKRLNANDKFYNNTLYVGSGITSKLFGIAGSSGTFVNNIVIGNGTTKYKDTTTVVGGMHDYNCYYGLTNVLTEAHSLTVDPLLVLVGAGTGGQGLHSLNGYRLLSTSSCINTGIYLSSNGGKDFFGNRLGMYDTLTDIGAHEYGDGSDLTFSNFESGTAAVWTTVSGTWSVENLNTYVYKSASISDAITYTGNSSWTNYFVSAKVKITDDNTVAGVLGRYTSGGDYYMLRLNKSTSKVELYKKVDATFTLLGSKTFTIINETWNYLKLVMNGSTLQGYVNGQLYMDITDSTIGSGRIGLRTVNGMAQFDEVGAGHN